VLRDTMGNTSQEIGEACALGLAQSKVKAWGSCQDEKCALRGVCAHLCLPAVRRVRWGWHTAKGLGVVWVGQLHTEMNR
jgi:hypothetical protein